MNEEERNKAYQFLQELDKNGYRYTADGREIYIIENVFHKIDKLQKELGQEKGKNKKLNLENQALFESINCNDDNMLARRYSNLQKELDKKDICLKACEDNLIKERQLRIKQDKVINCLIDLLQQEGYLKFDNREQAIDYIDKLIKAGEENE